MSVLNDRNLVKLEDVKITKNHYYLVIEYCKGGSLSLLKKIIDQHMAMALPFLKKLFDT